MTPIRYRKKPVEIEAIKFVYSNDGIQALQEFCGEHLKSYGKDRSIHAIGWAEIGTLEDGNSQVKHIASEGDYIIKGIAGEFYACKPDIFEATYEISTEPKVWWTVENTGWSGGISWFHTGGTDMNPLRFESKHHAWQYAKRAIKDLPDSKWRLVETTFVRDNKSTTKIDKYFEVTKYDFD